MMRRREILGLAAAAAAALALVQPAAADEFPSKPVKIVHGSAVGAPQDVMLRVLAEELEAAGGQPFVVESRPGGSGQVAMAYLKGQPADGYTIMNDGTGITAILQLPGAAHDWRDFKPIYRIQLDPFALYVKRDGNYGSLEDLVADMKARPGEIRIGGYGTGSPHQLTTLALADAAGVEVVWVPYNSGSDAIAAVMAGDLEAAMSNISVYGRFKEPTEVIAITAEERVDAHPEVPTLREEGYDIARYHWRGIIADKDIPDEVAEQLYAVIDKAVKSEGFQEYLTKSSTLAGTMSLAEFQEMLNGQAESDRATLIKLKMIEE